MKLFVDTRQKKDKHLNIEQYCRDNNITAVQKCLLVGDYMLENGKIAVDTKQSLQELANDLYADKLAFNKKYKKCYTQNIKLVVLVEEPIKKISELIAWRSKHTKISGRFLVDLISDLQMSYGISFKFCEKSQTGKVLIDLLQGVGI